MATRADAKYQPAYQYKCSAGHEIGADEPVTECSACVHGSPCAGRLRRFGDGARSDG